MNPEQTEAQTIADLARAASEVQEVEGVQFLLHHKDVQATSLEHLQPFPRRFNAHPVLYTLEDLVGYVRRHSAQTEGDVIGDHPVIFADRKMLTFVALLDYHTSATPSWLDHSATVRYSLSRQLVLWKSKQGVKMSQEQFAEFLDENIIDIVTPSGSEVLSFAENLEATRTETFKSAIKLTTGETKFTWNNEKTGDVSTKVIEEFALGIPLWERGQPIKIQAKLFHRITEGKLSFFYRLEQLENVIDVIWDDELAILRDRLGEGITVYQGTPPAAAPVK